MKILNRKELMDLIKNKEVIQCSWVSSELDTEYSRDTSNIQPCSIDLHVGEIYLPGVDKYETGGKTRPITKEGYIMEKGETIMVRTLETLKLPLDIGGICFAPARESLKGLLIVNIGHIDPGYEGNLHFTIINLSGRKILLTQGIMVSTLLLFNIDKKSDLSFGKESFVKYNDIEVPRAIDNTLHNLSKTFMDYEGYVEKSVKLNISKTFFKQIAYLIVTSIFVPIIIAFSFSITQNLIEDRHYEKVISNYEERLSILEERIKDYEKQLPE